MAVAARPKLYHIVHVDRLPSIIAEGGLVCDAEVVRRGRPGTTSGMNEIKRRRLEELTLSSHPGVYVGDCVPFYFCPRSVMLYVIFQGNHPELVYRSGQDPIIHLEADLRSVVDWAHEHDRRWAFTLSNAGSYYFEDRSDLAHLDEIDWEAVEARDWRRHKDGKQAEFLLERSFPWELVERIGVHSPAIHRQVVTAMPSGGHRPPVEVLRSWYY